MVPIFLDSHREKLYRYFLVLRQEDLSMLFEDDNVSWCRIFGLRGNMKIELFHGVDVFRLHSQMLLTCLDVQLDGVNILGWLQF